jgi:hypothetical protein
MSHDDFKQAVVDTIILGMKKGGIDYADVFRTLFEQVYDCGYNECRRNMEEKQNISNSGTLNGVGMDPR